MTEPPLVRHLRNKGISLCQLIGDENPQQVPMPNDQAEEALVDMVEKFTVYEDGITSDDLQRLEDALRAIRARINGDYDLPALVEAGPLGNKDTDILRIIKEVLHD